MYNKSIVFPCNGNKRGMGLQLLTCLILVVGNGSLNFFYCTTALNFLLQGRQTSKWSYKFDMQQGGLP